nr:hypothetical protein [Bacillus sp. FJAT-45037]
MKKGTGIFIGLAVILIILGLTIQVTVEPNDERVIIDHTKKVYSAPECYDNADLTNNLEETTYQYANDLNYEVESSCTSEALSGDKKPILLAWFS